MKYYRSADYVHSVIRQYSARGFQGPAETESRGIRGRFLMPRDGNVESLVCPHSARTAREAGRCSLAHVPRRKIAVVCGTNNQSCPHS